MKTLYLLRHAKSDWGEPGLEDIDRPLNKRGRKAAPRMGALMAKNSFIPKLVLCSAARRTRETASLVLAAFKPRPVVRIRRKLYLATPEQLTAMLGALDDEISSVMIIGHNPGLEEFALRLAGPGSDAAARARLAKKFPTGALAVLHSRVASWSGIDASNTALAHFYRPRGTAD